ncbi:OLC1v1016487C1 [Oldenlandia corymbosa var. corymbosa]|uniref:OLC1v1016487C1 n=1 Tax=Oldenlandia corymbosa var. corymbosa TaxID=529605 RepID=A0AAV1E724_OLDCO|nr:OLC1v1016487C1 [Oldenlandia corymbosa var. corymbosa]
MENGEMNLESKFAGLVVNDSNSNSNRDGLFQVMKAVEAAEATIKQQVDENNRLRVELQRKTEELQKLKLGDLKVHPGNHLGDSTTLDKEVTFGFEDQVEGSITSSDKPSGHDLHNTIIFQRDLDEHLAIQGHKKSNSESYKVNGTVDVHAGGQATENSGFSEHSSPSASFRSRYLSAGESSPQLNLYGQGQISVAEVNNSKSLKLDLALKIREHEEEILRLRKHLSEYSVKEAQIRNEKFVLEKRIAYMRMAFDQQQQDLVDAASKAISYRQDIIEENIRLTYALQAAQQERSTFISSLMPLLAEYAFQPHVADAQTIVSHVKVLFRHMQEKLLVTEAKLKESQYQMAPWRSDVNTLNFSPSPAHSSGIKNGLELVPQPPYSNGKIPTYLDPQASSEWDLLGNRQSGLGGGERNAESDDLGRYSPLDLGSDVGNRELAVHPTTMVESVPSHQKEETSVKQVKFKDLVSSDVEDSDADVQQNDREQPVNWRSKNLSYPTNIEDPSTSYSPYLPPVLEEPSSSFSEAGDDDPLPAIEGLQISGEAFPGRELQACGYSINGTTSCNFEWVRHLADGSFNYIDGAKQPLYLVTADDVDTYLAIEVQPLDNRKRKGALVTVFANEHRKITCDPDMHNYIERMLYNGHGSYKVSLSTGYLDIWEPAALSIKRDGYNIKCSGPSGVVVSEKFSASTIVSIPYGSPTEFSIVDNQGIERLLRAENSSNDVSSTRDTIVLVLRLFVIRAVEKKKGKKRGLFFNK